MKILITGSAGSIGQTLVRGMKDRYSIRGADLKETPGLEDSMCGDLADFDFACKAIEGMEAIIHLGGVPSGGGPWEEVLKNNITATYNVYEAARRCGARRIAFASRAGLLSPYPQNMTRTSDLMPRPNSYYSVSKAFGENLGYLYASQYGLEVVAVRIGNFHADRDQPEHPHHLSHGDSIRVFEKAVTHPGVTFEIVFGVSDSSYPLYDLEHGRKVLDYHPQDRSEWNPPEEEPK